MLNDYSITDFGPVFWVFVIIIYVIDVVAIWKIFTKAGKRGWLSIIPVVNSVIMMEITWGRKIYFLLYLIPIVSIVIRLVTYHKLSKAFGHRFLFTLGLWFFTPIFYWILGYGRSKYTSPR